MNYQKVVVHKSVELFNGLKNEKEVQQVISTKIYITSGLKWSLKIKSWINRNNKKDRIEDLLLQNRCLEFES